MSNNRNIKNHSLMSSCDICNENSHKDCKNFCLKLIFMRLTILD